MALVYGRTFLYLDEIIIEYHTTHVFCNISHCFFFLFVFFAGKYAQVTNNPENDGCINAVLLV